MARWTVAQGDHEMTIEASPGEISIDVPSGLPFTATTKTAERVRLALGAAIGVANDPTTTDSTATS